jgi:hypothetical protein
LRYTALDHTLWRARFGRGFGPAVRQTKEWSLNERRCLKLYWDINRQNSSYWCSDEGHAVHKVPLHDIKFEVWCAVFKGVKLS